MVFEEGLFVRLLTAVSMFLQDTTGNVCSMVSVQTLFSFTVDYIFISFVITDPKLVTLQTEYCLSRC